MKKFIRLLSLTIVCIAIICFVSACGKSKITKQNLEWVKVNYHFNDVVRKLGQPHDKLEDKNVYYWFKGASNIENALKKLDSGKNVQVAALIFDDDNRLRLKQYTTLLQENRHILTNDILFSNINLTEENSEKIKAGDSYFDIIQIFGVELQTYDNDQSRCCYWFDGALSLNEAYEKAVLGKTVKFLEILFDDDNIAAQINFKTIATVTT